MHHRLHVVLRPLQRRYSYICICIELEGFWTSSGLHASQGSEPRSMKRSVYTIASTSSFGPCRGEIYDINDTYFICRTHIISEANMGGKRARKETLRVQPGSALSERATLSQIESLTLRERVWPGLEGQFREVQEYWVVQENDTGP